MQLLLHGRKVVCKSAVRIMKRGSAHHPKRRHDLQEFPGWGTVTVISDIKRVSGSAQEGDPLLVRLDTHARCTRIRRVPMRALGCLSGGERGLRSHGARPLVLRASRSTCRTRC
jgi:hypothetical protein